MQIECHGQIVRGAGPNSGRTQLSEISLARLRGGVFVSIGGGEDCAVGGAGEQLVEASSSASSG
jgi:hypothetical protein